MNNYIISKYKSIRDALTQLEKNDQKCLIAVDENKKIFGTLTDGDIRRALLKKANLDTKISNFVKKNPISIKLNSTKLIHKEIDEKIKKIIKLSKDENIDLIPIIDKKNIIKIVSTKSFKNLISKKREFSNVTALIMAGGRGKRLKQFSNYFPKPLFPVGDITAVEYIMNNFSKYGVKKFFLSLHYKKNLIKSYLKENNYKNIKYIEEKIPLGTAGCLGLIKGKIKDDFFLINCDSILSINLEKFYEFHKRNNFQITMVAASKNFKISYGACEINKKNGHLIRIKEKPNFNYLVSTGLYLIKPKVINKVIKNKPIEMDILIKKIKNKGGKIGVFPISENNWIDVGTLEGIK